MPWKSLFLLSLLLALPVAVNAGDKHEKGEALGKKTFAVVLLDYANDGSAPSVDELKNGFLHAPASTKRYFDEVSYGKMQFHAEFFGWIVPSRPLFGEGWTACWPLDKDRFNLLLSAYPNTKLSDYDGFIFYVNRKPSDSCGPGLANTYGLDNRATYAEPEWLNTRIIYLSTKFYLPHDYGRTTNSTVTHEIIHGLGISNHSSGITCEGEAVIRPYLKDCQIVPYGDLFSAMGNRNQGSHPNAIDKERLEWLDKDQIVTVSKTQKIRVYAMEKNDKRVKAIKVPLLNPIPLNDKLAIDTLYIEYRGMTGFDERNDFFRKVDLQPKGKWHQKNRHGALIYGADCEEYGYCIPYLLNMNPGSVPAKSLSRRLINAYLFPKKNFEVPLNPVSIRALSVKKGDYIELEVKISQPTISS